jgi:hypothetical protein
MATCNEFVMLRRKPCFHAHLRVPTIGDGGQMWIERGAQVANQVRQRITKIFVLTAPKAVALQMNVAPECLVVWIECADVTATLR